MKQLHETNVVKQIQNRLNKSILFSDESYFSLMEYKVMKNWMKGNLIQCGKLKYNGKIKLVYYTEKLTKFEDYINYASDAAIYSIVLGYLKLYFQIQANGFLNCCNLLVGSDDYYVDEKKNQAMLIYLPLENNETSTESGEFNMRRELHEILTKHSRNWDAQTKNMIAMLRDFSIPLAEICEGAYETDNNLELNDDIKKENSEEGIYEADNAIINGRKKLILTSSNYIEQLEFEICLQDGEEFLIGKNPKIANGVISDRRVSRQHCQIFRKNGCYYIKDLKSTNGTFLDKVRLKEEEKLLKDNAIIRIANIDFIGRFK